jgi:uncharacterized protein
MAAMKSKKVSSGSKTKLITRVKAIAKRAADKARSVVKPKPKTTPAKRPAAKPKLKAAPRKAPTIPEFLLEGDRPTPPPVGGPGEKFALGPTPPAQHFELESAELPAAYGTGRLYLTARDPHWLYAHWDLTPAQQSQHNTQSLDGHLILRIYRDAVQGEPISEIHVHPESRHWFAPVERAATKYTAELGYYGKGRKWKSLSTSAATLTPPDSLSSDLSVAFATIPVEVSFAQLVTMVKQALRENLPLAQAVEELRRRGHPALPAVTTARISPWTPAQEKALAQIISIDQVRRVWIGSLEITELIRRRLELEISSIGAAQFSWPTSPGGAVTSVSSPFGGEQPARGKGFWFNVNAELIIYGATERDASVTIGGRKIQLRPDGSFSYRFALPDGKYDLPVVAVSADETDGRAAALKFTRATELLGEVGAHPQDPALKPPTPENV